MLLQGSMQAYTQARVFDKIFNFHLIDSGQAMANVFSVVQPF